MDLTFRLFAGQSFRPRPAAETMEDPCFFAIVTPWGPQTQAQETAKTFADNYIAFSEDKEATSIYRNLRSLSREENILRRAALSANEAVFKGQNRGKEYSVGYEAVFGVRHGAEALFVQIGHPAIFLDCGGDDSLQPLGHVLDLAGAFSPAGKRLPPLPSRLLGIHEDIHCSVFSVPLRPKDRLIFLARAFTPAGFLNCPKEKRTLDHLSRLLAHADPSMPFWLGLLDFAG